MQQRIVSLEAELRERDARLEEVRREAEARIEAIEASKREAIQTNVELRLALHARYEVNIEKIARWILRPLIFREMNKVQTAINAQLEQVIERQKHLGEMSRTKR